MSRAFFDSSGGVVCPVCAAEQSEVSGALQPIDAVDLEDMFPSGVWCNGCGLALVAPDPAELDDEDGLQDEPGAAFEPYVDDPYQEEED